MSSLRPGFLLGSVLVMAACSGAEAPGSRLSVEVAPLSLVGVTDACYSLAIANEAGEPVAERSQICASRYGALGGISYVAPCDATDSDADGVATNTVTLTIDGISGPTGALDFIDPCAAPHAPGGCALTAACVEGGDTPVRFDLTVMRQADQGFFDVAVTFEDMFCSAKVDCVDDDGPLELLHHPVTDARAQTAVVALACAAGPDAQGTRLLRDPITLTCGATTTTLDPALGPGNVYGSGPSQVADPDPTDAVWQYAVYAGDEALSCGGASCRKRYWNVAIGFDPTARDCRLTTTATAVDAALPLSYATPPGAYPIITYDVPLTTDAEPPALACSRHPLNGEPAGVATTYTPLTDGVTFFARFATTLESTACPDGWTGPTCTTPVCAACVHGTCTAPNTCACAEGWAGAGCDLPVCDPACVNGTCTAPGTCTCAEGWVGAACDSPDLSACVTGTTCDDGDLTTWDDRCDADNVCVGQPIVCPPDTICASYTPNGAEACAATYTGPEVSCDDLNPATHDDTCNGSGGCIGAAVECPANTVCASYTPNGTPTCTPTFAASTTACSDGNPETTGDFCNGAGACLGTPSACPANNPCNDGNPSTYNDRCNDAGVCAGTTIVCPTSTTCTSYVANGTSTCAAVYAPTSAACNDGDATTVGDFCNGAGACVGTPPDCAWGTTCNDGNNNTSDDRCSPSGACVGLPVSCPAATTCVSYTTDGTTTCTPVYASATTACSDGDASTSGDFCNGAGSCVGTPANCVPNTSCNDGDLTTYADRCSSGACVGTPVSCPADTTCTTYSPNGTSTCTATWANAATACDDGNAATSGDFCDGFGSCVGTPIKCAANSTCNDGNAQTYGDHCNYSGACVGTPVICPTSTTCVTWTADGTATCKATYAAATTTCSDGDLGTYADRCNGAGSCVGATVTCPTGNGCVTYTENGTATCTTTFASASTSCNDGNPATHTDTCNGSGQCLGQPFSCPAATACASYVATGSGTCDAVPTSAGTSCTGGGTCDGEGACVPPPVLGTWADLSTTTCGTRPSARQGATEVQIDGKLYVFGGHTGSVYLNDLHAYELATGCWTNLSTPLSGTAPTARYLHAGLAFDGKMYIFGGFNGSYFNDLRVYDPALASWTDLSTPLLGSVPTARYLPSAFTAYGKLWFFGGNTGAYQNNLVTYDPTTRMWATVSTTGTAPSARQASSAAVINGKAYFFGGYNGSDLNDLYSLDLVTNAWTNLSTPLSGTAPSVRRNHVGVAINGRMLIYGGGAGTNTLADFYAYDPVTRAWTPQPATIDGVAIPSRQLTAVALSGDAAYVFGGLRGATTLNDLLKYTGASAAPDSSSAAPTSVAYDGPWRFTAGVAMPFEAPTLSGGAPVLYSATGLPAGLRIAPDTGVIYGTPTTPGGPADAIITASNRRGAVSTAVSIEVIPRSWTNLSTVSCGTAPGARALHSAVTIGAKIYLFGGQAPGVYKNDLYSFEPATGCWADLSVPASGSAPTARSEHDATVLDGKMYVYGGYNGGARSELLVYDPVARTWTDVSTPLFGTLPAGRYGATLWSAYGKVYVFGGYTGQYRTDLYTYDPASRTWTTITPTGTGPTAGYQSSAVVIDGKAYIFGGSSGSHSNQLFALDLATHAWTNLSTPLGGTAPTARQGHVATVVNGKMLVFGGTSSSAVFSDLHTYDPATRTWVNVSNTLDGAPTLLDGTLLAPRQYHSGAMVDGVTYVFGGSTTLSLGNIIASPISFDLFEVPTNIASSAAPASITYNSPWVFTQSITIPVKAPTVTGGAPTLYTATNLPAGLRIAPDTGVIYGNPTAVAPSTGYTITASNELGSVSTTVDLTVIAPVWTDLSSACGTTPPARYTHSEVAINGKVYVFGGSTSGTYRNDLYAFDVDTGCWTNLSTPAIGTVPTARSEHDAVALDGKMYIYGGYSGGARSDLQVYDPVARSWTDLSTPLFGTLPTGRYGATLWAAYGKIYVFGGYTNQYRTDLYTYDPATRTWTTITPTGTGPTAGYLSSAVVINGKAYVFGGTSGSNSNQLFALDLVTHAWTNLSTPLGGTAPTARYGHVAGVIGGKMYIFGGWNGTAALSDLHAYDPTTRTWTHVSAIPEGSPIVLSAAPLGPRVYHGAAVVDGVMYVFGGYGAAGSGTPLAGLMALEPYEANTAPLTASAAPASIVYTAPWIFTQSITIDVKAPTTTGGAPTIYTASGLPPGLKIAPDTGVLYGTPTTPTPAGNATITAANALGSVSTTVGITVLKPDWTDLSAGTCGTAPSVRYAHGAVTIDRKIYVFGGYGGGTYKNDLHSWDKDTGCWTNLSTPLGGTAPGARNAFGSAAIDGKLYIFGGYNGGPLNDLHVYDPVARSWTNLSTPLGGTAPLPRSSHTAFSAYGKLWVFGGYNNGYLNDLRTYDPTTRTWAQVTTTGAAPSGRYTTSVAVIDGVAYLFGGDANGHLNDLRALDLVTLVWTTVTPLTGTAPTARSEHSASVLDGKMYIVGGYNGSTALPQVHSFDPKTRTWLDFGPLPEGSPTVMNAAPLVGRASHTGTAIDGAIHVFGGYYGGSSTNTLAHLAAFEPWLPPTTPATVLAPTSISYAAPWIFTQSIGIAPKAPTVTGGAPTSYSAASLPPGLRIASDTGVIYGTPTTPSAATAYTITASNAQGSVSTEVVITVLVPDWTDLSTGTCGTAPSVRYAHGAVTIDRKIYVFGGYGGGAYKSDLHSWDKDTGCWTNLSTPLSGTAPGARTNFGAAALDGRLYVFGGWNGSPLNDLHVYDPVARSWTNLSTPLFGTAPLARSSHTVFAAYGRLWVFGGYNSGYRNDLHTYDPTTRTWAQLTTTGTVPSGRYATSVAVIDGVAYLFGGYANGHLNDLRALDLVTLVWTTVTPLSGTAPTPRAEHSASVLDGKMVLFGGYNGSTALPQVHSYDPKTRTWLDFGNLPEGSPTVMNAAPLVGRASHTATVIDGAVHVFGGYFGNTSTNTLANLAAFAPYLPPTTPTPSTAAPATLSYSAPWLFTRGVGIALMPPTVSGGAPTSYSASELPPGIHLAPDTGVLYGTPTASWPSTIYTITASNELGSVTADVDITVLDPSWTDLSTPLCGTAPSARYGQATVSIGGRVYVFGGNATTGVRNDLHAYDVDTACWIDLSTPLVGTAPSARYYPAHAVLDGKLYIFGGYNGGYLGELHVYDPSAQSWTNLTAASTGTAPSARSGANMAAANGKLYLLGGEVSGYRSDLFTYTPSGAAGAWATITPSGSIPAAGYRSMVLMGNKLYVFGGTGTAYFNDLHALDLATNTWTSLNATSIGAPPSARAFHTAVVLNGEMYVFGGANASSGFNDLFLYDPVASEWINLATLPEGAPNVLSGAPMPARDTHGAAAVDGVMYVFGGRTGGTRINSLLAYLPYW